MPAVIRASVFFAAMCLIVGCSSTRLETHWKDPAVTTLSFTRLMVVAPLTDGATRRMIEDTLAGEITQVPVITSYQAVAQPDALKDHLQVVAAAKAATADALVVMRVVGNRAELNYSPGSPPAAYASVGGYWGPRHAMAPMMYHPPVVTTTQIMSIETNLYRVADGKLIWSGVTSTREPRAITDVVKETVAVLRAQLRKEKLIAGP
jgi:hypothetical protein